MCEPPAVTVAVRFLQHQSIQALPPPPSRDIYSFVSTPSTTFKTAPHTILRSLITRSPELPSTHISDPSSKHVPDSGTFPVLRVGKGTTSSTTSTASPPSSPLYPLPPPPHHCRRTIQCHDKYNNHYRRHDKHQLE